MNFRFLAGTIYGLILNTEEEWEKIRSENHTAGFFSRNLVFPLVLMASVSSFLGSILFIDTGLSASYAVLTGIKYFILFYITIYGAALIFSKAAKSFNTDCDRDLSFKLAAGSIMPLLLCQIVSLLFESFIFVNVLAFYGLYIFWTGLGTLSKPPSDKKIHLLAAETAIFLFLFLAGNKIITMLFDKIYYTFLS